MADKKRISGRGCRAKGTRAEVQFTEIMTAEGVPSQRVIGSGAFGGAKSDVKVGVDLDKEGNFLPADEGSCLLRVEVKNRQDNPEWLFVNLDELKMQLTGANREGSELLWTHLNQDSISKAVILKRAKTPSGALKNKDYNQAFGVFMGLGDFIKIMKLLHKYEKG